MPVTRRQCLQSMLAVAAAGVRAPAGESFSNYFGDLHNHNSVGYAQGSLRRSFEIAREHLDFYAFTPHAWWHDIARYDNSIEDKWVNGFAVTRARWQEALAMAREFDAPGRLVTIAGYEWHSTYNGDYHVLFPSLDAELNTAPDLAQLQTFARKRGCILVPHHPANRLGHRGANFVRLDRAVSPVIEMYSEWGNAESDRAPYPYIRHTEGGRWTRNTLHAFLAQGLRFGVIASTDDHLGYPGAWGEGLAVVKAVGLTREAIFDALRSRRCYAVTGDRIALDFHLNGRIMGQELAFTAERTLEVAATGWDQVDRVEVLKNNRVVYRDFPMDRVPTNRSWDRPLLVRFEYGWGPWPVLGIGGTADWNIGIRVDGGRLEALQPCFLSGPLEEGKRDRIVERSPAGARLLSYTALKQQFEDRSQKAVVLKVRGGPETRITFALEAPRKVELTRTLAELVESGETLFTADFPRESALVNRAVFDDHYRTSFSWHDTGDGTSDDWYYVRVVQANGQLAWSSPVWVNRKGRESGEL